MVYYAVMPIQSEGWIAHDGRFFTCDFRKHTESAVPLTRVYYDSDEGEVLLEKNGWIKVYLDGRTTNTTEYVCTQKQLDTLAWLMTALTDSKDWKSNIEKEIRKYRV